MSNIAKPDLSPGIKPADFRPFNKWEVYKNSETFRSYFHNGDTTPLHIEDLSGKRVYLNEPTHVVQGKSLLLVIGSPLIHGIGSVVNMLYRTGKLLIGYHFWPKKDKGYSFTSSCKHAGLDLLRIITQPLAFLGLTLAALYGVFCPYSGRKLYASIERWQYNGFTLARCFQPLLETSEGIKRYKGHTLGLKIGNTTI